MYHHTLACNLRLLQVRASERSPDLGQLGVSGDLAGLSLSRALNLAGWWGGSRVVLRQALGRKPPTPTGHISQDTDADAGWGR